MSSAPLCVWKAWTEKCWIQKGEQAVLSVSGCHPRVSLPQGVLGSGVCRTQSTGPDAFVERETGKATARATRGVRELIGVFRPEDEVLQALGTGGAPPSSCCPSAPRAGPYPVEQLTLCTHRLPEIPSARPSLL